MALARKKKNTNNLSIPTVDFGFDSPELTTQTAIIMKAETNGAINKLIAASALLNVKALGDDVLKSNGFKNLSDYGAKMFGYAKSNTYDMIAVAKKFNVNVNGEIGIPELEGFSWTALNAMKNLDSVTIDKLIGDGVTPNTPIREIRSKIKKLTPATDKKTDKKSDKKSDAIVDTNDKIDDTKSDTVVDTNDNTNPSAIVRFGIDIMSDGTMHITRDGVTTPVPQFMVNDTKHVWMKELFTELIGYITDIQTSEIDTDTDTDSDSDIVDES